MPAMACRALRAGEAVAISGAAMLFPRVKQCRLVQADR